MSISYTYATLVTAIQNRADDDEPEFVSNIPSFIAKGETRVIRDLDLECFEQWLNVSISSGTRTVTKPTDVIDVNELFVRDPTVLKWYNCPRRSFEYCAMYAPTESATGAPVYYAEYDPDTIYVVPTPVKSYAAGNAKVRCTIRPTGLSSGNTTTHLGNHFGDLLYEACMIEAHDFLKHPEAMKLAAQKYQSLLPALTKELENVVRVRYKNLNKEKQGADD